MPSITHESTADTKITTKIQAIVPKRIVVPIFVAGIAAATLTGCTGIYVEQDGPQLPNIPESQEVFQQLVRNETAVLDSLTQPGEDCQPCMDFAADLGEKSKQRSELLGGLWEPWGENVPDGAPLPDPVPQAGSTWAELTDFIIGTATADLAAATELDSKQDQLAAASVAAGRLADGLKLSDLLEVQPTLPTFVTPTGEPRMEVAGRSDLKNLGEVAAQWDCAAQWIAYYGAGDDADGPSAIEVAARAQVDDLVAFSQRTISAGAPDQRALSCLAPASDEDQTGLSGTENKLFATNLAFLLDHPYLALPGEDDEQNPLAFEALTAQLTSWVSIGNVPATPGVTKSDVPKEAPTEPTQFAPFYNNSGAAK
ncbi:hypothetical protein [Actinomyces urinae]|uniref:hypothetical protein n=1 Tax=Actinomyces urinae TaxID=1689268 RepID=UPI00093047CB|nr:hypothetical protein [Actinomyces urinae]